MQPLAGIVTPPKNLEEVARIELGDHFDDFKAAYPNGFTPSQYVNYLESIKNGIRIR